MEQAPKLPPKPVREQAKVLYAYEAQNEDELTIREGDIINVLSKEIEDQGWFKGELNGKVGVFPDNFVELIKVPVTEEEKPLPPRPNKTVSSSPSSSNPIHAIVSVLGKNKSTTDGNSLSNGSKAGTKDEASSSVSTKTSLFGLKKSSSKTATSSSNKSASSSFTSKPDVVPHESLNESTSSTTSTASANNNEASTSGIEGLGASASSKLNHLTANRAKGPSNRRPPSYISTNATTASNNTTNSNNNSPSKESAASGQQENGIEGTSKTNGSPIVTPSLIRASSVTSETSSAKSVTSGGGPVTSPGSKGKEDPPWMVELRKTQEAKKGLKTGSSLASDSTPSSHPPGLVDRSVSLDSSSSSDGVPIASNRLIDSGSKSVTSPNRASGDFSSRVGHQFNGSTVATSSESSAHSVPHSSSSSSILKPTKPLKPPVSSAAANINNNHNNNSSLTTTSANSLVSSPVIPSTLKASSSSDHQIIPSSSSLIELQKELKSLRESMISRKEFDDLAKQVRNSLLLLSIQVLSLQ